MRVIFDLDGTLANIEHRLHHIRTRGQQDWATFFKACVRDTTIVPVASLARRLKMGGVHIAIWTARSEEVRLDTLHWLNAHHLPYDELRMRAIKDHRQDDVLKAEWLKALPRAEWPDVVFEDRTRVVDMWRAYGVTCCQVAPGDF